jgi:DNA polymerase delta subunit 4
MPPTRRSNTKAAAAANANPNQRTLSFNNATKISKTAHHPTTEAKKSSSSSSATTSKRSSSPLALGHPTPTTSALPAPSSTPASRTTTSPSTATPEEILASKITDAKIKQYWQGREQLRLAPRVHQKELSVAERVLREWDCMTQFGVSGFVSFCLVSFAFYLLVGPVILRS